MRIVLAGALPDPREARELLPHLLKAAPNLGSWLEFSHATRIVADPAKTYCTAWEYWQLQQHGFRPEPGQTSSAGLGPILVAGIPTADDPVWLLELVHISPSRDGAVLIPAKDLAITADESAILFQSAQELFADTGFSLQSYSATHWRIALPADYAPACASPALVSISTVNEWWRQDLEGRAWRRLANELQMLWFDHPVNQARYDKEYVPINGVWLFGGARTSQFDTKPGALPPEAHVVHNLSATTLAQDWSNWLYVMTELDRDLFSSLDNHTEIVFTGHDRILTFSTQKRFWERWLPGTRQAWKKSWLTPN